MFRYNANETRGVFFKLLFRGCFLSIGFVFDSFEVF